MYVCRHHRQSCRERCCPPFVHRLSELYRHPNLLLLLKTPRSPFYLFCPPTASCYALCMWWRLKTSMWEERSRRCLSAAKVSAPSPPSAHCVHAITEIAVVRTHSLLCVTSLPSLLCRNRGEGFDQDCETSAKPASASERVLASTSALSFTTIGYGRAAERRRGAFENVGDEFHVTAVISWGVVPVSGSSAGREPASLLREAAEGVFSAVNEI